MLYLYFLRLTCDNTRQVLTKTETMDPFHEGNFLQLTCYTYIFTAYNLQKMYAISKIVHMYTIEF